MPARSMAASTSARSAARPPFIGRDVIEKVETIDFPEFGMEAVWRIRVKDFPAFVIIDDKGGDFFAKTI